MVGTFCGTCTASSYLYLILDIHILDTAVLFNTHFLTCQAEINDLRKEAVRQSTLLGTL